MVEPQLQSALTCPHCGHHTTETMPTDACQYFYDCKGAGRCWSRFPATVAFFAPMAQFRAHQSKLRGAPKTVRAAAALCRPKPPMIGSITLARVCWRGGFLTPWSLQGYSRVSPRGRPFGSPRLFGWGPPPSSMPDESGRTHCRFTGPYYLAMTVSVLVLGSGVATAGLYAWIALAMLILLGDKIIWWATERTWGTFSYSY